MTLREILIKAFKENTSIDTNITFLPKFMEQAISDIQKLILSEEEMIAIMTAEEIKVAPTGRDVTRKELAKAIVDDTKEKLK